MLAISENRDKSFSNFENARCFEEMLLKYRGRGTVVAPELEPCRAKKKREAIAPFPAMALDAARCEHGGRRTALRRRFFSTGRATPAHEFDRDARRRLMKSPNTNDTV